MRPSSPSVVRRLLQPILEGRKISGPIRFPRLRRTAQPALVDQALMLYRFHRTGEVSPRVVRSQAQKLLKRGRSDVAINRIRFNYEPLEARTPGRGGPILYVGRPESDPNRH